MSSYASALETACTEVPREVQAALVVDADVLQERAIPTSGRRTAGPFEHLRTYASFLTSMAPVGGNLESTSWNPLSAAMFVEDRAKGG